MQECLKSILVPLLLAGTVLSQLTQNTVYIVGYSELQLSTAGAASNSSSDCLQNVRFFSDNAIKSDSNIITRFSETALTLILA